jgi:hypothetical protein
MTSPLEDIEALMKEMNQSAFKVAASFDVTLDYSDASVRNVEQVLAELHQLFTETKDDSGLRGIALFFAAYIGETIRRKGRGGSWSRHHPVVGQDTFPFTWNGEDLFLFGWCQKRIFDGEQDDVWAKYRVCVLGEGKAG